MKIFTAIVAIIFAWLVATAVISLWRAPLRDPEAPLANRKTKKRRRSRTRTGQSRMVAAPPSRGRRLVRRDQQGAVLPPDATVSLFVQPGQRSQRSGLTRPLARE